MKRATRSVLNDVFAPITFALAAVAASWLAAGATLVFFVAVVAFAAIFTPALVEAGSRRASMLRVAWFAVALAGSATVPARDLFPNFGAAAGAFLIGAMFIGALAGATTLLRRAHVSPPFAAAIVTLAALAWLAWPIWLAGKIQSERVVGWLVGAHPIFAVNSLLLRSVEPWTQLPLMYRLTTLGQDVPYQFPKSVLPCLLVHGIIAMGMLLPAQLPDRSREDDRLSDR